MSHFGYLDWQVKWTSINLLVMMKKGLTLILAVVFLFPPQLFAKPSRQFSVSKSHAYFFEILNLIGQKAKTEKMTLADFVQASFLSDSKKKEILFFLKKRKLNNEYLPAFAFDKKGVMQIQGWGRVTFFNSPHFAIQVKNSNIEIVVNFEELYNEINRAFRNKTSSYPLENYLLPSAEAFMGITLGVFVAAIAIFSFLVTGIWELHLPVSFGSGRFPVELGKNETLFCELRLINKDKQVGFPKVMNFASHALEFLDLGNEMIKLVLSIAKNTDVNSLASLDSNRNGGLDNLFKHCPIKEGKSWSDSYGQDGYGSGGIRNGNDVGNGNMSINVGNFELNKGRSSSEIKGEPINIARPFRTKVKSEELSKCGEALDRIISKAIETCKKAKPHEKDIKPVLEQLGDLANLKINEILAFIDTQVKQYKVNHNIPIGSEASQTQ